MVIVDHQHATSNGEFIDLNGERYYAIHNVDKWHLFY